MSGREEDQETLVTILGEDNKNLYEDKLFTLDDPFRTEKLYSDYKNCLIKIKEKIYCEYLKQAKEKTNDHFKIISYCSHGKRKNFVETVDKDYMIEHLVSRGVIPTCLIHIKKNPRPNNKPQS